MTGPATDDGLTIRHIRLACKHGHHLAVVGTYRDGRCRECVRGQRAKRRERVPLYSTWTAMHQRCSNLNNQGYPYYGGRGIGVCARWDDFWAFVKDIGDRPPDPEGWTSSRPYWTLDRIDVDGDYEPANCRWASPRDQLANRRERQKRTRCAKGHEFAVVGQSAQGGCKACKAAYDLEYRAANRERRVEQDRAYYAANKDRILQRNREARAANKEGVAA